MLACYKIKSIALLFLLIALTACGGKDSDKSSSTSNTNTGSLVEDSTSPNNDTNTPPAEEPNVPNQNEPEAEEEPNELTETFSAIPLTSRINHVQPMTGIVFWADNDDALNALGDSVQLEFSYMVYSDIVQEAGTYNWQVVDQLLDKIAARGHQAILRFRYTYPGETGIAVPSYIANAAGYNITVSQVEGENTFLPDWSFPALEAFTLAFFQAFADRYDGDPRLAILQIGFGSYAEYHLYDGPISLGNNFPSKDFQTSFLTMLENSFQTTHWAISIDAAANTYSPFSNNSTLRSFNFGLFDDSFMHQTHSENDTEYNRAFWLFFGS